MRFALRWMPWIPLCYSLLALAAELLLRLRLPLLLERTLAGIVAPLLIIYYPIYPLLRPLGMIEGEWLAGPTTLGVIFGALLYGAILWGLGFLLFRR